MNKVEIGAPEFGVLAGMLRKVDFFAPLTVGQLDKILPQILLQSYAAGETVFRQGQPGDAFYIVYKGKVEIRLKRMVVLSKTVAALGPGDFFGEIALVSDEPRTAAVVCTESTYLFTLIAGDFKFVLNENPAAAEEMKRIAARRKYASAHSE